MQNGEAVRNPGENSFRIDRRDIKQLQVCGDQRRFLFADPLVKADKKLGSCEMVRQFCAEVIDDQQVAVKNIAVALRSLWIFGKGFLRQKVKQVVRGKINHRMSGVQQFFGYTVRQKRLSHAGVTE